MVGKACLGKREIGAVVKNENLEGGHKDEAR